MPICSSWVQINHLLSKAMAQRWSNFGFLFIVLFVRGRFSTYILADRSLVALSLSLWQLTMKSLTQYCDHAFLLSGCMKRKRNTLIPKFNTFIIYYIVLNIFTPGFYKPDERVRFVYHALVRFFEMNIHGGLRTIAIHWLCGLVLTDSQDCLLALEEKSGLIKSITSYQLG